jgi:O-antigen ligase
MTGLALASSIVIAAVEVFGFVIAVDLWRMTRSKGIAFMAAGFAFLAVMRVFIAAGNDWVTTNDHHLVGFAWVGLLAGLIFLWLAIRELYKNGH